MDDHLKDICSLVYRVCLVSCICSSNPLGSPSISSLLGGRYLYSLTYLSRRSGSTGSPDSAEEKIRPVGRRMGGSVRSQSTTPPAILDPVGIVLLATAFT